VGATEAIVVVPCPLAPLEPLQYKPVLLAPQVVQFLLVAVEVDPAELACLLEILPAVGPLDHGNGAVRREL
jgi:hypothetical protein